MPFPEHLDEGTIHGWLDGQLPPDEAAAVESHVATCAACAALVAEARGFVAGTSRILGALDFVGSGRREVGGGGAAPPTPSSRATPIASRRTPRRWMIPSAAAATLLVAIGTTLTVRGVDDRVAVESATYSGRTGDSSGTVPVDVPQIRMPSPSPVAKPTVASAPAAPSAVGSSMGGADVATAVAAAGGRESASEALAAQKTLPPQASPAPAQALEERARATAKAAPNEQSAVAAAAPAPAPAVAARRQVMADSQADSSRAAFSTMRAAPLVVSGRVTTGNAVPVQGASVLAAGLNLRAFSGADGQYALIIPGGRIAFGDSVRVHTRHIGYQADVRTVVLPAQGDITLDVVLTASTASLNAVVVTGIDAAPSRATARARPAAPATTDWAGCYALERVVSGFPARFQLDSTHVSASSAHHVVRAGADVVASWAVVERDTVRLTSVAPPARTWMLVRAAGGTLTLDRQLLRRVACPP